MCKSWSGGHGLVLFFLVVFGLTGENGFVQRNKGTTGKEDAIKKGSKAAIGCYSENERNIRPSYAQKKAAKENQAGGLFIHAVVPFDAPWVWALVTYRTN